MSSDPTDAPATAAPTPTDPRATLRETVQALAPLERLPCSAGEHEAAHWLQRRLEQAGAPARIEEEQAYDSFARPIAALCAIGAAAGLLAARANPAARALGGTLGALAMLAIGEDVSNGPRLFRRLTMTPKSTLNVVAELGDPRADSTLVLLAHHDAAPTGMVFDPALQRLFGDLAPGLLERIDTSLPVWWPVVAGPGLVALGAARGRRDLVRLGMLECAVAFAAFADIARSPVTPGANDNLSGVAVLVALAERLGQDPPEGLRVLLVSCGSEETLQGGIRGFAARHFPSLDRDRTWVLNIETVGSPELILLEGEGTLVMEDYHGRGFRDRVARAADRAGVHLRRGMRARSSTDSVIPSRAGYATATLSSMDRYKSLTEYHQLSDTPEKLDFDTVADAAAVAEALIRSLAARRGEPAAT